MPKLGDFIVWELVCFVFSVNFVIVIFLWSLVNYIPKDFLMIKNKFVVFFYSIFGLKIFKYWNSIFLNKREKKVYNRNETI
jgi:hypothetical protein